MSTATQRPDARPPRRRRVRRAIAIVAGAGVGAAAYAGIASAGLLDAPRAGAHDRAPRPAELVERQGCQADPGADRPEVAGASQVVTVTVRPTALVWVDGRGRVTGAWTNTGCAPRPSDDVFVQRPDGTIRPAAAGLVERRWTGDFREPGVRVAQRPAG